MTRILLVRHAQTEWNRVERFRGRIDIELNETGRQQALALAQRLGNYKFEGIYASPLKRAIQTAEPLAETCELQVQPLRGVIDIDYGAWAGHSLEEVADEWAPLHRSWLHTPHLVQFPQGEGLDQVRRRALHAVEESCIRHPDQTIVLVSHLVVNRVLICAVLGPDNSSFWQIPQDNAAINVFEVEGGQYRLISLNDTCHLESPG